MKLDMLRRFWPAVPALACCIGLYSTVDARTEASSSTSLPVAAGGALVGRALFDGSVPAPRKIEVNADMEVCRNTQREVQDVVVGADGALSGVVVEIAGVKQKQADLEWPPQEGGYVIRQKDCRFQPSFMVVPNKTELIIYNDDPVLHNLNTAQWNLAQPGGTVDPIRKTIMFQGRSFERVGCNVHGWMEAYVYIARSPYYAVTGADGRFRIENVPAGSYRVSARHPKLGAQRFKVEVGSGETAEQVVTFKPR